MCFSCTMPMIMMTTTSCHPNSLGSAVGYGIPTPCYVSHPPSHTCLSPPAGNRYVLSTCCLLVTPCRDPPGTTVAAQQQSVFLAPSWRVLTSQGLGIVSSRKASSLTPRSRRRLPCPQSSSPVSSTSVVCRCAMI